MALSLCVPAGRLSALPPGASTVHSACQPAASSTSPFPGNGLCVERCFAFAEHAGAPKRRFPRTLVRMGLRAVETFDGSFQLKPECEQELKALLGSETFCRQVAEQPGVVPGYEYEFTGQLFQPIPWSVNTKHGMPQEFEKYYHDKDNFAIVNIPPNFMFKAKVFHPSRLCAVFRKRGTA